MSCLSEQCQLFDRHDESTKLISFASTQVAPANGAAVFGVFGAIRAVRNETQAASSTSQQEDEAAEAVGEAGALHGDMGSHCCVARVTVSHAGEPRLLGRHLGNDDVDWLLGHGSGSSG